MEGKYKTPSGEILNVTDFEEDHKIAYAENKIGQFKWYPESEYSTWEPIDESNASEEPTLEDSTDNNDKPIKKKTRGKANKK